MGRNLLDRMGDWNPQLMRELKGSFKVQSVAIAIAISLLFQLFLFGLIISTSPDTYPNRRYCHLDESLLPRLGNKYNLEEKYQQLSRQLDIYLASDRPNPLKAGQLQTQLSQLESVLRDVCPQDLFDVPLWWQDFYAQSFIWIAFLVLVLLLVMGVCVLIADLSQEERRGTLNFLRLSPQSGRSILVGKLLGVPCLLYLAIGLTLPFQFWLGIAAHLSPIEILSFWIAVAASCVFFYSGALLLALVRTPLGDFQVWLGGGIVLTFLLFSREMSVLYDFTDWLALFFPTVVLPYLVGLSNWKYVNGPFFYPQIKQLIWFNLPLGRAGAGLVIFMLLNDGLWIYWLWQALKRRFDCPNLTILSKQQSYCFSACLALVSLGFALPFLNTELWENVNPFETLRSILSLHLLLFVGAIAIFSPQRQTLQDWARDRQERLVETRRFWPSSLFKDLLQGEKSPALLALVINLAILAIPIVIWILLMPSASDLLDKNKLLLGIWLTLNLSLIYALFVQWMLLTKMANQTIWVIAAGILATVLLPQALEYASRDFFDDFFWLVLTGLPMLESLEQTTIVEITCALLAQGVILAVLTWQLTRQLQQLGTSQPELETQTLNPES